MGRSAMTRLMFVSLMLILSSQASHAQQRSCSLVESEQADREASRLRTWDALYRSYHRFVPRCDDGSIAEGYSESVRRILLDHWVALPRVSALSTNDPGFRKFVLRHIDATIDIR